MTMFKRIDHVEIIPSNADVSLAFYTQILGFRIIRRNLVPAPPMKEVIFLQLGDSIIEVMVVENPSSTPAGPWQTGYRAIAIEVDDMAEAIGYLTTKGATISRQPVDLGDSYRAEIQDPDGFAIELRQWKKANR